MVHSDIHASLPPLPLQALPEKRPHETDPDGPDAHVAKKQELGDDAPTSTAAPHENGGAQPPQVSAPSGHTGMENEEAVSAGTAQMTEASANVIGVVGALNESTQQLSPAYLPQAHANQLAQGSANVPQGDVGGLHESTQQFPLGYVPPLLLKAVSLLKVRCWALLVFLV